MHLTTTSRTPKLSPRKHRLASRRGFTLVELLAVVAMIGILSAIALVGYRRYLTSARTANAKAVIGSIRVAEENFRAETLAYQSCSGNLTDYFPATPNGRKRHFYDQAHLQNACWRELNVITDSPTTFGYALMAGGAGTSPAAPVGLASPPTWPATAAEPWYVIQAAGNEDNDATQCLMVSSSFNGEIYVENETE